MLRTTLLALVLILLVLALPALAQDAPDEPVAELPTLELGETPPEPDTLPVADPAVAFDMLIKTISAITVGFASSPFAVTLVSLLKRIPALETVSAPTITFVVGTVLWLLSAIFGALGYSIEFNSLLEALTTILPALAGLFAVLIGAPALHDQAAKRNVAFLGYSRTPPPGAPPPEEVQRTATYGASAIDDEFRLS